MGWFDTVINDFRKKKDQLVNSRFNVVNQARSAIALAKPNIQQGWQRVKQTPKREFILPTSKAGYTGLQQLPTLNVANKVQNPVRRFVANIGQDIINTPIRTAHAVGRIGQDYAQGTTTAPRLIGNVASIAETPLTFATFGTGAVAKSLIKQGGKGAIKLAVKQGAKTGAKYGASFGLLQGLESNREAPNVFSQFLKSTPQVAGGAVLGGVLGGGISGGSAVFSKAVQQLTNKGVPKEKAKEMVINYWRDKAESKVGLQVRDINKDKIPAIGIGKGTSNQLEAQLGRKLSPSESLTTNKIKQIDQSFPEQPIMGGGQGNNPINPSSPSSISDPVNKIIQALKEAKPIRGQQEALYTAERAKRVAKVAAMGEKVPGEQGYFAQLGQLKGSLPKVQFESIRKQVSQPDIDALFNTVEQTQIFSPFEKVTAKTGLAKLLAGEGGTVPTEGELKLLSEVFPPEFVQAVLQNRSTFQKLFSLGTETLNLPRAVMATADLSAPLRQGVFLIGRPQQWIPAFGNMFKYAGRESAYKGMMEQIQARPTYKMMRQSKLALTDMSAILGNREEMFMSNLSEKIPLFGKLARASNRAYSGFLNKLRADVFDDLVKTAQKQGIKVEGKTLDDIARFVNSATGRGELGILQRSAPILNGLFFSPRLMASRINLLNPVYYAKLDPFVRKEALKSLITFSGTALTVLGLAKLGGADVSADPRNADFGKIKVGNTRYDILGGFQQYLRLAGQLITGQKINSQTGKLTTLGEGYGTPNRKDILLSFFESKTAPVASFAIALLQGQNAIGEKFNLPTEVINRFIPMVISDMYDISKEAGNPLGVAPGIFGVGTQTYGKTEAVTGKNQLGEPTSQIRPVQGLGETISTKLFGQQPLGSSSGTNIGTHYDQMLKMPKEQAAAKFDEIAKTNPDLAKKITQVAKDRKKGVTVEDQVLKAKGVASGDRTMAIMKEFDKLKTPQEKAALWNHYVKVGIITKDVAKQLKGKLK